MNSSNTLDRLEKLKELLSDGLLSEDEFNIEKAKILGDKNSILEANITDNADLKPSLCEKNKNKGNNYMIFVMLIFFLTLGLVLFAFSLLEYNTDKEEEKELFSENIVISDPVTDDINSEAKEITLLEKLEKLKVELLNITTNSKGYILKIEKDTSSKYMYDVYVSNTWKELSKEEQENSLMHILKQIQDKIIEIEIYDNDAVIVIIYDEESVKLASNNRAGKVTFHKPASELNNSSDQISEIKTPDVRRFREDIDSLIKGMEGAIITILVDDFSDNHYTVILSRDWHLIENHFKKDFLTKLDWIINEIAFDSGMISSGEFVILNIYDEFGLELAKMKWNGEYEILR